MSAEERMVVSKKGYENGLGAMLAEENKMRMDIVWEEKYAEFVSYKRMPEIENNWQKTQLSNGPFSFNAKIRKENEENEWSTIWSERRVKLVNCVDKKNRAKMSIVWEEKYAEFVHTTGCQRKEPCYIIGKRIS
jgi:hypothetical protein